MQPINIISKMTEKPSPINYTLPGLIAGTVGSIVSPGGTGKSALALQLAAQVAGGPDLLGIKVAQGKAVYLPAEDPEIAITHRLYALGEHCSTATRERIHENLSVYPLEQYAPNILDERWELALRRLAEGATLMVLDTLRMFHQADENDNGEMSLVVGALKRIAASTGCTILFIHHTTKSSALNGQGDEQQASRGASVLTDNIRWQSFLSGMTEAEADDLDIPNRKHYVKFGTSKINYGSGVENLFLERCSAMDEEVSGYTLNKVEFEDRKNGGRNNV